MDHKGNNNGKLKYFREAIDNAAEKELQKKFTKKINAVEKKEQPAWFNSQIKKEIGLRRTFNKIVRKAKNEEERAMYKEQ